MHKTYDGAMDLVEALMDELDNIEGVEVVLCPPFPWLLAVAEYVEETPILLGAQDCYWADEGAFTGEVSAAMLAGLVQYCIVGHSERRGLFGETDEQVNKKVKALLSHDVRPICCVGERLAQREAGETDTFITGQVRAAFADVSAEDALNVILAYEPIWAIGTGRAATADEANRVIGLIRGTVRELYGEPTAEAVRIQYGGSVTARNIAELMTRPEIDGALVGGASLRADEFAALVRTAAEG
jgi:triosephosphate isomerase